MLKPETQLTRINRHKKLVDEVVTSLSTYILEGLIDGTLHGGDKMPNERELSEILGIGRSTLREAVQVLSILNLLDVRPGQGTFIADEHSEFNAAPFSWGLILRKNSFTELIESRIFLEQECVRLASLRATEQEYAKLERAYREMEQALENEDTGQLVSADVEFHLVIAHSAHNSVLYEMLRTIRTLMQIWISKAMEDSRSLKPTISEHKLIFEAMLNRNGELAARYMGSHIQSASERLMGVLSQRK
ncbi:FadR family transcriptional regulator [Alicyclobacillus tolerans]|uniref:FadR/GntR family transcriptional regulator n=1 Tax=Alicyclobacillus tolerans TaxID=90970 RepID=UPI001F3FF162|nr:FadR/GntR family transcriptional regulator [Alicyclobacillus tolerans]MCF8565148.1 FadR family transcriptional regulator [Alicyclobacillus tolerans]